MFDNHLDESYIGDKGAKNRLARWILKYEIILNTYDPMMIYKQPPKSNHWLTSGPIVNDFNNRNLNKLRIDRDEYDIVRKRWRPYLFAFIVWFFLKSLVISTIHILKPRGYDEANSSWLILNCLSYFLGNPFSGLADVAVFIMMGSSCSSFVYLFIMPLYYAQKPMQMGSLRFLLDPSRERKRADLLIDEKLDQILASIQFYQLNQLKQYTAHKSIGSANLTIHQRPALAEDRQVLSSSVSSDIIHQRLQRRQQRPVDLRECKNKLELLELNRKQLLYYKRHKWILSLYHYSDEMFKLIERDIIYLMIGLHLVYHIWMFIILLVVFSTSAKIKCTATVKTISLCHPFVVFNWKELWYAGEFIINLIASLHTFTIHFVMLALLIRSQSVIIRNISLELNKCLDCLRQRNVEIKLKLSRLNGREFLKEEFTTKAYKESERRLDQLVLKTLIRMQLYEEDLKIGSHSMSVLMVAYGLLIFVAAAATISTQRLVTPDLLFMRQQFVIYIWLVSNTCAVICAHIFAQVLDFQQICWSTMAESSLYQELKCSITCEKRINDVDLTHSCNTNYTVVLWRKMIYTANENWKQFVVRPLGIDITYRRVLELNFFIVSFYSLLAKRDQH